MMPQCGPIGAPEACVSWGWDMSDPPRCPPRAHWVLAHCGVSVPLKEFGCSLQGALWAPPEFILASDH